MRCVCLYARVIRPSYTASVSTCKSEMLIALEFAQFIRYSNSTMTKALPLCYAAMGAKCGFGADFFLFVFSNVNSILKLRLLWYLYTAQWLTNALL